LIVSIRTCALRQAAYLAKTSVPGSTSDLSVPVCALLCVVVFAAYYVWDVANQQKNTYRIMQRGDYKVSLHPTPYTLHPTP
jgi:hypothetical protein